MANGIDYGWAYVAQNIVTGAGGDLGSIQFKKNDVDISGSTALTYDYATTTLILSGTLHVSGTINANALNLDVTNKTVTNLTTTGSTKFGDSADDTHVLTGSTTLTGSNPLTLLGLASGSVAGLGSYLGVNSNNQLILSTTPSTTVAVTALNNKSANRLVSIGSTTTELDGEANLTFDGSVLSVTGELTSSIGMSGSIGRYTELTSSNIKATVVTATTLGGTLSTVAQANITSVGNLSGLTVDTTTLVVNGTSNKVAIGRAAPDKKLEVVDNSDSQLRLTHTASPAKHVDFRATSNGYLSIAPSDSRVGIGTAIPTAELAVTGATHISGDVGIGTTTPAYKLDVGGDTRITGNLIVSGTLNARVTDFQVSANTLTFGDASGDAVTINAGTVATPNGLNFDSNTLVIDAGNNRIGIGAANPDGKLHVLAASAGSVTVTGEQTNGVIIEHSDVASMTLLSPSDGVIYFGDASDTDIGRIIYKHSGDESDSMRFWTNNAERVRIDSAGKVGIGTRYPEVKLHVSGDTIITEDLAVTGSITGSALTDGTVKVAGGNILSVGTLAATNITGTLGTAAQTNITSVGNLSGLTVDSTTLVVNGTSNKVSIGRAAADKKLEIVDDSAAQLRLTHTTSPAKYVDFRATSDGNLYLAPNGNKIGIGTALPTQTLSVSGTLDISASANPVKIYGLQSAETANSNVLTSSGTVITEYVSASILTYTNPSNNRLVTSVDATSVNSEANLTFDGTDLKIAAGGDLYTDQIRRMSDSSTTTKINLEDEVIKLFAGHSSDEVVKVQSGVVTVTGQMTGLTSLTSSVINNDHLTSSFGKFTTVTATNLAGTLTTAAQANITSVGNLGNLTVDSTTLVVKSTTNRVGIGRSGPERKLEVLHVSDPQLRLTNVASTHYTDFKADGSGNLTVSPTGAKATFEKALFISASSNPLNIQGLVAGTPLSNSYLALDGSNNIILTSAGAAGIETRNRRQITTSVTASATDYYIGISASAALSIQLLSAASLDDGQTFTIKDEAGNSDTNNVTVYASGSQTIDGEQYVVLESSYAAINLYTNGTDKYFIF